MALRFIEREEEEYIRVDDKMYDYEGPPLYSKVKKTVKVLQESGSLGSFPNCYVYWKDVPLTEET